MTNDSLDLLVDFRSEVSPPDEATTRRIYRLATAAPLHRGRVACLADRSGSRSSRAGAAAWLSPPLRP